MAAYRTEIDIAAPAQSIWALVAAVSAWPSWTPTVIAAEALGAADLEPGHRFRSPSKDALDEAIASGRTEG